MKAPGKFTANHQDTEQVFYRLQTASINGCSCTKKKKCCKKYKKSGKRCGKCPGKKKKI